LKEQISKLLIAAIGTLWC